MFGVSLNPMAAQCPQTMVVFALRLPGTSNQG